MQTEGVDIRSVGNTLVRRENKYTKHYFIILLNFQVLQETALVEIFNLKAAIEYRLKNCEGHLYKMN